MSGDFLDSNVLLYLIDEVDQRKRQIAERLVTAAVGSGDGVISFQVVQETLNVLTRKLAAPVPPERVRHFVDDVLVPLWTVYPSPALYHRALDLQERWRFGFYDSLIVAAALEAGCDRVLTEDLQDGQQIEGLTIENPFRA